MQQHKAIKYDISPLSPISKHRLNMVRKKVLVLDLDETLIHSHHDGVLRPSVKPGTPPDFILKVTRKPCSSDMLNDVKSLRLISEKPCNSHKFVARKSR